MKRYGKERELALKLWATGLYEARMLAWRGVAMRGTASKSR